MADALVNMIRAGAGLGDFHESDATELVQFSVRRGLLGYEEGEELLAEIRGVGKRSRGKPRARRTPKKAPTPKPASAAKKKSARVATKAVKKVTAKKGTRTAKKKAVKSTTKKARKKR